MPNTRRGPQTRHMPRTSNGSGQEIHCRLRAALAQLQHTRCALHDSCHAVTAAEADLFIKRQEREQLALQVATLAELVETLERELGSA